MTCMSPKKTEEAKGQSSVRRRGTRKHALYTPNPPAPIPANICEVNREMRKLYMETRQRPRAKKAIAKKVTYFQSQLLVAAIV